MMMSFRAIMTDSLAALRSASGVVASMPTNREPIDDMIDAHVWMRRTEAQVKRLLTLDSISGELLAEFVLARGSLTAASYRCTDPTALLVALAQVTGPDRKLNEDALRRLLCGVRDGADLPPVVIFREPQAATATLLDGLHRYRLSLALGFTLIPAIQPSPSLRPFSA
jgi:hypothetical protein